MKEQKVGIVSCYFKNNYGSMLQAYATQQILDNLKIENETIDMSGFSKELKKKQMRYYLTRVFDFDFLKTKMGMIKLKIRAKLNRNLRQNFNTRNQKFNEFKTKFRLSEKYQSLKELSEKSQKYTDVLVGSDQLWLPVNVIADYYTLSFVPEQINKISYATSFGIGKIPAKYENRYKLFLERLDFISVREERGKEITEQLIHKDVELVCDPTLLLTKDEWEKVQVPDRIIEEPYIFCYFLGNNIEHRKFVERLKEETGCKIVSLNHCDEYVKYSDTFADVTPYDVGPAEFLNLVSNAEYICTDSFHGTMFSLIYQKSFFAFRRHKSNLKMSTNSRIQSILKILNLESRLLNGDEEIKTVNQKIDYVEINKKLNQFRDQSIKYLKRALGLKMEKDNDNIEK